MRGKPHEEITECYAKRITPADAGKTHPLKDFRLNLQDHPRGCGENFAGGIIND